MNALELFGRQIVIPATLWQELNQDSNSSDLLAWLHRPTTPRMVRPVPLASRLILDGLSKPQCEAVTLAAHEKIAILTDDMAASREAALHAVSVVGTLDVLNFAQRLGLLKFDGTKLWGFVKDLGIPGRFSRERNVQLLRN